MTEETTGQGTPPATGAEGGQAEPLATPPAPGVPETPPAGDTTAAVLQAQLAEQRSIQAGLDKRIAQLTAQLAVEQQAKEELTGKLQELQSGTTAGAEELESLRQTLANIEGEKGQWEQQLATAQAHAERIQIVATEFPALAPLVNANSLPQAPTVEEFRQKLGEMAKAFTAQANVAYQQMAAGVKPPASPPSGAAPGDPDSLHRAMLAAQKEGNMDEFRKYREQWYAAMEAEGKS